MNKIFYLLVFITLFSCKKEELKIPVVIEKPPVVEKFGYIYNDFKVFEDTIKKDETFGYIMDKNHVENPLINKIVAKTKSTFDIARQFRVGKPYTILAAKDSTEKAQVFIYQPNKVEFVVIDFRDSIIVPYIGRNQVKSVIKTA